MGIFKRKHLFQATISGMQPLVFRGVLYFIFSQDGDNFRRAILTINGVERVVVEIP